jgi:pyruvate kinase
MNPPPTLADLREAIRALRSDALAQEARLAPELARVHPTYRAAARNLTHYLALRQHDVRDLQGHLAARGLSSLGRSERCVLATLEAVSHALTCLQAHGVSEAPPSEAPTTFGEADELLQARAAALLGPVPRGRSARIMPTLAPDIDAGTLEGLLARGADAVRINCAKGSSADWARLIERVRSTQQRGGHACRILCDLAGPNPRTAALGPVPDDGVLGRLGLGGTLFLTRALASNALGKPNQVSVGCTLPEVLEDLRPGERVYYDDGKARGVVKTMGPAGVSVELDFTRKSRVKIRAEKGLNFPDTKLGLPPLSAKDHEDLEFVARHADMVGLSFVRSTEHVELVQAELARLGAPELGIVLKIETTRAFELLPRLLLTAMRSPRVGVMVARGDMALELGFERLAEAQEEVLWLCEAAFVPVIWATQVLDVLNRTGQPSRAEVTDAAMSGRAECVMLNQGKHQLEALEFLRSVLERMAQHQQKKRSMLRRLRISNVD